MARWSPPTRSAESLLGLLKTAPWKLFALLAAWMGGRPKLKRFMVQNAPVDPVTLPYREEVLDEMRRAREDGRQVLLVTASDQGTADAVAGHVELFDEAIGSDGESNLKADRKAEYLVSRFGVPEAFNTSATRRPTCPSGRLPTRRSWFGRARAHAGPPSGRSRR